MKSRRSQRFCAKPVLATLLCSSFLLSATAPLAQGIERGLKMAICAGLFDQMTRAVSDKKGLPSIWPSVSDRWLALAATQTKTAKTELEDWRLREHRTWSFEFAQAVNGSLSGLPARGELEIKQNECSALVSELTSEGLWKL